MPTPSDYQDETSSEASEVNDEETSNLEEPLDIWILSDLHLHYQVYNHIILDLLKGSEVHSE